jgi:hypothetical protein
MVARLRLAIIIAASIMMIWGCGLTAQTTASATWTPGSVASAITTRSASASNVEDAGGYQLTVTASCHVAEQLIGGGFSAGNVFEFALFLRASYPANNAWTVKTDSISHYAVTAFAYCLRGEPSLGTRIVSGKDCPTGSAALSHGKTENGEVTLCASRHVASASRAAAPITLHATGNGYQPEGGSVECPSGALALDGGSTVGLELSSSAGDRFASWQVVAGGDGAGEVYANCVTFE